MASRSVFFAWLGEQEQFQVRADARLFEHCLSAARSRANSPVAGFFGPASQMWRIFGETAVSLGGLRSVLMQLAHPAIASAGLQSSNFREDFVGRAWRTFATMSQLVFGDVESACEASRRLHVLHARTRGEIAPAASDTRAGEPYRGTDPALLLWVLATLYEGSAFVFERFVAPLSEAERGRYWDEMQLLGQLLGIPDDAMPPTVADFATYWDAMAELQLEVGDAARELAAYLVRSPVDQLPPWLRRGRAERLAIAWTAGSAPPEWAAELAVGGPAATRDFDRAAGALRVALRLTPPALRRTPAHHQALVRIARDSGDAPTRAARTVTWLGARRPLPMALAPIAPLEGDDRLTMLDLFEPG